MQSAAHNNGGRDLSVLTLRGHALGAMGKAAVDLSPTTPSDPQNRTSARPARPDHPATERGRPAPPMTP
jgi:hypothetical protein